MKEFLPVSVAIPAYNESVNIAGTLKYLKYQDYKGEIRIIVCDNGSSDNTVEIAEELGALVVKEKRKGSRFAYDTAIRASDTDIVLITNADVKIPPNWVSSLVSVFDDPDVAAAGTRVDFFEAPEWVRSVLRGLEHISPKRGLWGTSMATRRDVFDKVGGFDHGVNTNEDGIYTLLAEKYGKIVFVDDVTVYMEGRRYNRGIFSAIKEWTDGIGLNAIYIQIMYMLTGEIKHLSKDFRDIRVRPDRKQTV